MPDITMCSPEKILKVCEDCYRRTAKPSMWQSYSRYTPVSETECDNKMEAY
jgi:hypothetical protein